MGLNKSICKRCRIKELGKSGWNQFAEAWFDPIYNDNERKYRDGTTTCPYPIFDRIKDSIKRKALISATPAEKAALIKDIVRIANVEGSWTVSSEGKPPVWCPYKREHIKHPLPPSRRKRNKSIK